MTDRRRSNETTLLATKSSPISRRELLRVGGLAVPASLLLPAWLTANAQSASASFDFYVSPSGSDSNPGTVGSPWAITSLMNRSVNGNNLANFAKTTGKRIGFLPGTYNVSSQMQHDSHTGAIQINGGTSSNPTYYGSSDSNGNYSLGTATISALTGGGLPGGGLSYPDNGPILGHSDGTPNATGNITIDGLKFTGYSYKAVRIGGQSSGDGPTVTGSVLIKNCEFYGQFQQPGATMDNFASIWLDGFSPGAGPFSVTNNYFHNNAETGMPTGGEHLGAIFCFGCASVSITYNTVIGGGSFWGKDKANQGNTIAYNYIDNSVFTNGTNVYGFNDWTGAYGGTSGLTLTSNFHHNIIITGGFGAGCRGAAVNENWETPVNIYNNTIVLVGGENGPYPAVWCAAQSTASRSIKIYNNIITGAADGSGYGHVTTSPRGLAVCDYNGIPSNMSWRLVSDGATASNTVASYSSASEFASGVAASGGISGCESHSVVNSTPGFIGSGTLAQKYQLQSGSPFKGAGSTTGTPSGTACDIGAWANGTTQVGCNFSSPPASSGNPTPMAPVLTVS